LVWAVGVAAGDEVIEPAQDIRGGWLRRVAFEREAHAFLAPVLLRYPGLIRSI
jgi:hypothetical protein